MPKEQSEAPSGHLTVITGQESYLVEREVARLIGVAQTQQPGSAVTTTSAEDLTLGLLDQMAGNDLFSSSMIACITRVERIAKDVEPSLLRLAAAVPEDVTLIITHQGTGQAGKSTLATLSRLAAQVVDCPTIKAWDLPQFVAKEVRSFGRHIAPDGAATLVEAVGQDTRALAAAVRQLVDDVEQDPISVPTITRYFAGRASVTAYAVSDDALAGKVGEATMKLRWALSTGVAHTHVTSALAAALRQIGSYLAISRSHTPSPGEIGVPQWKMKNVAASARSWSEQAVAGAIRAVAHADAQVKGAASDPDFALERLIIRLASLRRAARR